MDDENFFKDKPNKPDVPEINLEELKKEVRISKIGLFLIIAIAAVALLGLSMANYNLAQGYNEMVEVFNDQLEDCPCLKVQPRDNMGNSSLNYIGGG